MRVLGLTIVVAATIASSCAAPLVRVAAPDLKVGPPGIERLVDLGGRPLPDTGPLSRDDSDGVLTPGEWVAVLGQNLDAGPATKASIDGNAVPIQGHLRGGSLLIQIPRHLGARKPHVLTVATPAGLASAQFAVRAYVVVGDTDGKAVHFLPIDANAKSVLSKSALDLDVKSAFLHALAPGGAWLYIVQSLGKQSEQNSMLSEIAVVHLGASGGPRLMGSFPIRSVALPTSATMLDDRTLLVLTESELLVCDVGGAKVALQGRVDLPGGNGAQKALYIDVAAFSARPAVAILEALGNVVLLVDVAEPRSPRLLASLAVSERKGVPWSIDLIPDPDDGNALWLLQGPNLRMPAEAITKSVDTFAEGIKAKVGLAKPGSGCAACASARQQPDEREKHARLLQLRAESSSLQVGDERPLPQDFYPFYVLPQGKRHWLVSGVNSDVFRFAGLPRSVDGVKAAIDVLAGSVQFGRILRLRDGAAAEPIVKGSALYFNMDALADGTVLYSVLRPGVNVLPPSLTVEWGVESAGATDADQDYRNLTDLEWQAMIPPYTFGMLSVQ